MKLKRPTISATFGFGVHRRLGTRIEENFVIPITNHKAGGGRSSVLALPALVVSLVCSFTPFEAVAAIPDGSRPTFVRNWAPEAAILAQVKPPPPAEPLTGQPRPRPEQKVVVRPYRPLEKKMDSNQCAQEAKARGMTNPFSPERRAFIASCLKW
jgi:hypothetical protein